MNIVEWNLDLVCCGRDDGHQGCVTETEAEAFRRAYLDAEGHDRTAILTKPEGGVPRGWRP